MKLKLGLMTGQEIAEWFQIQYKSYYNAKSKKLEELKEYCDYEEVPRKGILITNIKIDTYIKSGKQQVERKFNEVWPSGTPNTPKNVSKIIYNQDEEVSKRMLEKSAYDVVKNYRYKNYGSFKFGAQTVGQRGNSKSIVVKVKTDENGIHHYTQLTPEENQQRFNIYKRYFKTNEEWFTDKTYIIEEEYRQALEEEGEDQANKDKQKAISELYEEMRRIAGLDSEEKWARYKKECYDLLGETCRAIVNMDGIFFEEEQNIEFYLSKSYNLN